MVFWKSLSNWPLAANLDDLVASNFLPASQVEAADVEVLLSSQGSRIVSIKDSSIAFLSWSVLITFKSSESSKEVNPGSIEAFCYASLCCYREHKALYTALSRFSSYHGQFFRPLNLDVVSVTTVRRRDVTRRLFTVLTTLRPHELTIVELRVACTRYPAWSTDRYSPTAVTKWNSLPGTADAKAPFPSKLALSLFLFFLQLALATLPLEHLSHLFRSSPSKLFLRLRSRRREEAQSRPEEEFKPSCHPWLCLRKRSSRFAGRL
jgi:hypothetical protein